MIQIGSWNAYGAIVGEPELEHLAAERGLNSVGPNARGALPPTCGRGQVLGSHRVRVARAEAH